MSYIEGILRKAFGNGCSLVLYCLPALLVHMKALGTYENDTVMQKRHKRKDCRGSTNSIHSNQMLIQKIKVHFWL